MAPSRRCPSGRPNRSRQRCRRDLPRCQAGPDHRCSRAGSRVGEPERSCRLDRCGSAGGGARETCAGRGRGRQSHAEYAGTGRSRGCRPCGGHQVFGGATATSAPPSGSGLDCDRDGRVAHRLTYRDLRQRTRLRVLPCGVDDEGGHGPRPRSVHGEHSCG